jgi:hypothetical protein
MPRDFTDKLKQTTRLKFARNRVCVKCEQCIIRFPDPDWQQCLAVDPANPVKMDDAFMSGPVVNCALSKWAGVAPIPERTEVQIKGDFVSRETKQFGPIIKDMIGHLPEEQRVQFLERAVAAGRLIPESAEAIRLEIIAEA